MSDPSRAVVTPIHNGSKTTPDRNTTAPTADDRGSGRTHPSEGRERPMAILPAPTDDGQPVSLDLLMAEPMSRADGCPGCINTEPPRAYVPLEHGYRCAYLCSDCGHAWTTDYREDV